MLQNYYVEIWLGTVLLRKKNSCITNFKLLGLHFITDLELSRGLQRNASVVIRNIANVPQN